MRKFISVLLLFFTVMAFSSIDAPAASANHLYSPGGLHEFVGTKYRNSTDGVYSQINCRRSYHSTIYGDLKQCTQDHPGYGSAAVRKGVYSLNTKTFTPQTEWYFAATDASNPHCFVNGTKNFYGTDRAISGPYGVQEFGLVFRNIGNGIESRAVSYFHASGECSVGGSSWMPAHESGIFW